MRDYILLYINGVEHKIRGSQAFVPLTDYLRMDLNACGTKVVCAEGDCGACTVVLGQLDGDTLKYKPVNGCIQYLCQLDCTHIITVEGLRTNCPLTPVQDAMVQGHGAQCGYCTPGFVVTLSAMFDAGVTANRSSIKEWLSGNLCRCTGYISIIDSALSVDPQQHVPFTDLYPCADIVKTFREHRKQPVQLESGDQMFFLPTDLESAIAFKKEHPGTVIISGGTDVSVNMNKRGLQPRALLSTTALPGLNSIHAKDNAVRIGANVTLRELENYMIEVLPELHKILFVFGSPQIRYAATLAGNIANGSPIADTLPFLFVTDSQIEVAGSNGTRRIKIGELYTGYRTLSLQPEEIITATTINIPRKEELLKLYKVSRREHLDISAFTAAIRLERSGESIQSAAIAYGGVGPVVMRLPNTESFLIGKTFSLETFQKAGAIARAEISPISDVRGSSDFRYQLSENILTKFFYETEEKRALACL